MIVLMPYLIARIPTTVRSNEDMMRVQLYKCDSGMGREG